MRPKTLHIGKYFPPYFGGMENYLRDLMGAQSRQGIQCTALVHQTRTGFRSDAEEIPAGDTTYSVIRVAVWARLFFTPISPLFPWHLGRILKQHRPDVIHLHMPNVSAFWSLFVPRARRIPWVVHWHSDVPESEHSLSLRIFYCLYRPFERAILRRASRVIVTSEPYLHSSEPLKPFIGKCVVVPLGLDPLHLAPLPTEGSPGVDAALRILAVGRLTYYKGFEFLIKAAALCQDIDVHLVGDGDQRPSLEAQVRHLGVQDRVHFHGSLPSWALAAQFAACDCLCLPSIERSEAFGLVLLEAMYYGKATLASWLSG